MLAGSPQPRAGSHTCAGRQPRPHTEPGHTYPQKALLPLPAPSVSPWDHALCAVFLTQAEPGPPGARAGEGGEEKRPCGDPPRPVPLSLCAAEEAQEQNPWRKGAGGKGRQESQGTPHVPMPSATPELRRDHSPPTSASAVLRGNLSSVLNADSWVLDLRAQTRGWGAGSPRPSGPGCHTLG